MTLQTEIQQEVVSLSPDIYCPPSTQHWHFTCMSQCNSWHFPELNSFFSIMAGGVFCGLKPGAWLPPCVGFSWWQAPFQTFLCFCFHRPAWLSTKEPRLWSSTSVTMPTLQPRWQQNPDGCRNSPRFLWIIMHTCWPLQPKSHSLCLPLLPPLTCAGQLRETDSLPRPVVLVDAENAEELMGLVNKNEEANVRIESMPPAPTWVSDF